MNLTTVLVSLHGVMTAFVVPMHKGKPDLRMVNVLIKNLG